MSLKLGRRLASKRCRWCRTWQVYECGYAHRGLFGAMSCSQCNQAGSLCADSHHPSSKRRNDY